MVKKNPKNKISTPIEIIEEFRKKVLKPLDLDGLHRTKLLDIIHLITEDHAGLVSPLSRAQMRAQYGLQEWLYLNYPTIRDELSTIEIQFERAPKVKRKPRSSKKTLQPDIEPQLVNWNKNHSFVFTLEVIVIFVRKAL